MLFADSITIKFRIINKFTTIGYFEKQNNAYTDAICTYVTNKLFRHGVMYSFISNIRRRVISTLIEITEIEFCLLTFRLFSSFN